MKLSSFYANGFVKMVNPNYCLKMHPWTNFTARVRKRSASLLLKTSLSSVYLSGYNF